MSPGTPSYGDGAEQHEPPVVRDRRRIDPTTGALREPASPAPAVTSPEAGEPSVSEPTDVVLARAQADAAERLEDLQRLQAEYRNYRRRVERDRELAREQAVARVLAELLPVLDDIGRARDHGDLTGAFKVVAEALESALARVGLERYGEAGQGFDPTVHEALTHSYSDEVGEPTAVDVLMAGYRYGDRVLRPARVAVAEPTEALPAQGTDD